MTVLHADCRTSNSSHQTGKRSIMHCSSLSEHQPVKCFCQCAVPLCTIWRSRTATRTYPQLYGGLRRIAPQYAASLCLCFVLPLRVSSAIYSQSSFNAQDCTATPVAGYQDVDHAAQIHILHMLGTHCFAKTACALHLPSS